MVIPKKIHQDLGLASGDYLAVERRGNQVILTPKGFIDRELTLALEDVRRGRTYGPFDSVGALMRSLRQKTKKAMRRKQTYS